MNRRSFIKSLTTVATASIFLPRAADAFIWKQRGSRGMWVINPEYITAPFEIHFWYYSHPDNLGRATPMFTNRKRPLYSPRPGTILVPENFPLRKDHSGEYIHPLIWKKSGETSS